MKVKDRINKYSLLDSCFWIALYEERDKNHKNAQKIAEYIFKTNLIIPWPTLYEFMNTRFARREHTIINFQKIIQGDNIILIEDNNYKKDSLNTFFNLNLLRKRELSLIDIIIRAIMEDINLKIDNLGRRKLPIYRFRGDCYITPVYAEPPFL